MFTFNILDDDIKGFMDHLLKEKTFDAFEVRQVKLTTFTDFTISGFLYNDETNEEIVAEKNYCMWEELRGSVFEIIKGKKKPKRIKIVFSVSAENLSKIHSNAAALYLNVNFEKEMITGFSAVSEKNFALDKSVESAWDNYVEKFLKHNKIIYIKNN